MPARKKTNAHWRLSAFGAVVALVPLAAYLLTHIPTGMAIVHGNSMTPGIERGDLVITTAAAEYHPGDVVMYHNQDLGLVIHRIVGLSNGRFTLKGDANPAPDAYQPSSADIQGRLALVVPGVESYIQWSDRLLTGPVLVVLGAILVAVFWRFRRGPRPVMRSLKARRPGSRRRLLGASSSGAALESGDLAADETRARPGARRSSTEDVPLIPATFLPEGWALRQHRPEAQSARSPTGSRFARVLPWLARPTLVLLALRSRLATPWRRRGAAAQPPQSAPRVTPFVSHPAVLSVARLLGMTAIGSAAVLVYTLSLGTQEYVPQQLEYDQTITLGYRAAGGVDVYDSGFAESGEPVYRRLADEVQVWFDYRLDAQARAEGVSGTYSLAARISAANGWSRSLELAPPSGFQGTTVTARASFSLQSLVTTIERMERATGVHNESYTVTLMPVVETAGTLDGVPFGGDLQAPFEFYLDSHQLQLKDSRTGLDDPLTQKHHGQLLTGHNIDRTLSLPIGVASVADVRDGALVALAILLPLLSLHAVIARLVQRHQRVTAWGRYGTTLVRGNVRDLPPNIPLVEVQAVADLIDLAETSGLKVLDDGDRFMLLKDGAAYFARSPGVVHLDPGAQSGEEPCSDSGLSSSAA